MTEGGFCGAGGGEWGVLRRRGSGDSSRSWTVSGRSERGVARRDGQGTDGQRDSCLFPDPEHMRFSIIVLGENMPE